MLSLCMVCGEVREPECLTSIIALHVSHLGKATTSVRNYDSG